MSKKGRNSSNNKKIEGQSNSNHEKASQNFSGENTTNETRPRHQKKYRIHKLIIKKKRNTSGGFHTKIYKVHSFTYKGKRYFYEF